MKRLLASLFLGACLLTPAGNLHAQNKDDHMQSAHQWNDGENNAWHQYLKERRLKDHEWEKAGKRERANYWKWRDQHRDIH